MGDDTRQIEHELYFIEEHQGFLMFYRQGVWYSVEVAMGFKSFSGYVSDKGELMCAPLMWRGFRDELFPSCTSGTVAVRAVAVRMGVKCYG